jgi:hypothetical protein
MMDRRIPELVLLLILAILGCMFAAAFNRWLFCAIFWIEAMWALFIISPSAQARLRVGGRYLQKESPGGERCQASRGLK